MIMWRKTTNLSKKDVILHYVKMLFFCLPPVVLVDVTLSQMTQSPMSKDFFVFYFYKGSAQNNETEDHCLCIKEKQSSHCASYICGRYVNPLKLY